MGSGLYTQLWGMFLLPPALAQAYHTLRSGRGYFWSVLLLAATLLAHLVFGYIAFLSLGLLVLLPVLSSYPSAQGKEKTNKPGPGRKAEIWTRAKRFVLLLVLVALVVSYFLIPFWMDRPYMNRGVWEEQSKYDSFGHEWVLNTLLQGDLFDFGRFPSLTVLVGLGLVACARHWREERYRVPVVMFLLWLLLYFGRPTWGVLLDLLPMSRDLHFHRLIAGLQLGGIWLIGVGLGFAWRWVLDRRRLGYTLAVAGLSGLLLAPVYVERVEYLSRNTQLLARDYTQLNLEAQDLTGLLATIKNLPPGRVYAGLGNNWGKDYKVGAVPMYALLNHARLDMVGYAYHALSLNSDIQLLFDENRPELYDLFNIRYVVAPAGREFPESVRPLQNFGRHQLYQVETSGYFDLVTSDANFAGDRDDFFAAASQWFWSELPAAKNHPSLDLSGMARDVNAVALDQAPQVLSQIQTVKTNSQGQILSEQVQGNRYQARLNMDRADTLLLKTGYHPNWRATVDGTPVEVLMLMPSYIGVRLPPGEHLVALEYRPRQLRQWLQILGLLILLGIAVVEWQPKRFAHLVTITNPALERVNNGSKDLAGSLARWQAWHAFKEWLTPQLGYLGGVLLASLLAGLPTFQFKIMNGHDAREYLPRAVEFYAGLRTGLLFPRWAADLSGGYGQPFFNFNPPLFYYLTGFWHTLGFSQIAAQNLSILSLLLLAGLGMYLLAGDAFGKRGGLVSSVAYLFAPYLLTVLYVRHALADFAAFAFLPFAFWGIYRYTRRNQPVFLAVGAVSMALLLLSSNPVALITFPFLLLLVALEAGRQRAWLALWRGLWSLGLGLGLAAFFWLPALVERDFVHLHRLMEGYLNFNNHFVYLRQFFQLNWGYGLSLPGLDDGMNFGLGLVYLLCTGLAGWLLLRTRVASRQVGVLPLLFLFVAVLSAYLASTGSQFLWWWLPLLQFLEFPWRFLSLTALSTAFLCGFPLLFLRKMNTNWANGYMIVVIGALLWFGFPYAKPQDFLDLKEADYSPQAIAAANRSISTAREYEPEWVKIPPAAPAPQPVTFVKGQGTALTVRASPQHQLTQVDSQEVVHLRANTFYFPGWTLRVNGEIWDFGIDPESGTMLFQLPAGVQSVELRFVDTPVRWWAKRLSLLALGLLVLSVGISRRKFRTLWRPN